MAANKNQDKTIGKLTNTQGGNLMFSDTELLFANDFVADTFTDVPADQSTSYRQYREKKNQDLQKKKQTDVVKKMNDPTNPLLPAKGPSQLPLNPLAPGPGQVQPARKKMVEVKRKIFIDSRHRDKNLYPDASDFVISWGRTFTNVKSMRLVSMEFPNVVQAIGQHNNLLYWINQEDADLKPPFPLYSSTVSPGSYTLTTLQTELTNEMKLVKRRGGQLDSAGNPPPRHLFIVDVNQETDYVGFTSIIAQAVGNNPVTTIGGSSKVLFKQTSHGYLDQERVHILGVMGIVGGLQASDINGAYNITKIDDNSFSFEIQAVAQGSATGGGNLVKSGREAPFQFLFGNYQNVLADIIGFPVENSGVAVSSVNPMTSVIKQIVGAIPGPDFTQILCPGHGLYAGDRVYLYNFFVSPSIYENDLYKGIFTIHSVPSPDVFNIKYHTERISDITNAYAGTQLFQMYWQNHGFNRIVDIEQIGPNLVQITTLFDHGFNSKSKVLLTGTNSIPNVDGYYPVTPIDNDSFAIASSDPTNPLDLRQGGHRGILSSDYIFYLYNVTAFGGFTAADLNGVPFTIRDITDADNFTFVGTYGFANVAETGGGSDIRINSKIHGWQGTQSNTINDALYKPVRLSGDNYAYMCVPGLNSDSISNSGPVKDIFAKIFISAVPGVVIFNSFDASPIDFAKPIPRVEQLRFTIKSPEDDTITFNGLDYSFGFELIEMIQQDEVNDQSSTPLPPPSAGGASSKNSS
jgi:hypothetical protein